MKTFENENYYQILQISPDARTDEIKHAYRDALAMYAEESVATYSLFSEKQREALLQAIETAYDNLVDADKRAAYNQMLIDTGQVDAAGFSGQAHRKLAAYSDTTIISKEKSLSQWVRKRADAPEIRQIIEQILSAELLSGQMLRQLRDAYGIELSEIYAITKISSGTLKMIEENQFDSLPAEVYLKQFLKNYAEILHIDPRHVVDGYLKFMAGERAFEK